MVYALSASAETLLVMGRKFTHFTSSLVNIKSFNQQIINLNQFYNESGHSKSEELNRT